MGKAMHAGSDILGGLGSATKRYGESLGRGEGQSWIPLLSGIAAMGAAPTRSLGVALASGLGAGTQAYQKQQGYGLEGQKVQNEANRVAAMADTARLAGIKAAVETAGSQFIDMTGQAGKVEGRDYPVGKNWYYQGLFFSPQEKAQYMAQLVSEQGSRQIGKINTPPISFKIASNNSGTAFVPSTDGATPAVPAPQGAEAQPQGGGVAQPHIAGSTAQVGRPQVPAAPDPLQKYRFGPQPTVETSGVDESGVPLASRYSAQMARARAAANSGASPEAVDAIRKSAESVLADPQYASIYAPYLTKLKAWKDRQASGQGVYSDEARNMGEFKQAATAVEKSLHDIAYARADTDTNTLSSAMASGVGNIASLPIVGGLLPPQAKKFQSDVVTMDKAATTLTAKEAQLSGLIRAPKAALQAEQPTSITSDKPPNSAYEMMTTKQANILQGKAWADEVQRLAGQDIDWNAYKSDWFDQHPVQSYVTDAAKNYPFSRGMSPDEKLKYIEKSSGVFNKKKEIVYHPATKDQLDAIPVGSVWMSANGKYHRK